MDKIIPVSETEVGRERICASCGGLLSQDGPKGGCLQCLLRIAFSTNGEPPSADAKAPRRRNYGHFAIDLDTDDQPVELGAGAMATTYRARDTVLHSAVALKVINQNVAWRPTARERFLREARAAANLRHPNIASVSHYGEERGECYYAMELVEGETLDARVRREGPLPPAMVLEVGIQVTCALLAAEAGGVVHRDLKPSNLMLTSGQGLTGGQEHAFTVKVIDWGLAKAANADSILGAEHTRDGFVGTPAFASPEQIAQRPDRRVDTRSDIYSLGATLWYLLCGHAPFVGDTLDDIHDRQRTPSFALLAAKQVPRPLVKLLRCMLTLDPAARPQSPRELLDRLQRCQRQIAVEATRAARRNKLRWLLATLATLVVSAGVARAPWHRSQAGASDESIAVLPFEDLDPDGAQTSYVRGLHDETARHLAYVPGFQITNINSRSSERSDEPGFRSLGAGAGVRRVLVGRVRRDGERVQVTARLLDAADGRQLWGDVFIGSRGEILRVPGAITQSVAACLGTTLSAPARAAISHPPTVDPVAYDLYVLVHYGRFPYQSETESDRYQIQVIIPSLEAALRRDPDFVLAHCDLAAAHDALIQCEPTTMQAETRARHSLEAEAALAAAKRLSPDSGDVHLALARHFCSISRFPEEARVELNLARCRLPDNVEVESMLGEAAYNHNRWNEAVHCFERAAILDPCDRIVQNYRVNLYHSLRRYDDSDRASAQLLAGLGPQDLLASRLSRTLNGLEARADLAPLRAELDTAAGARPVEVMDRYRLMLAIFSRDPDAATRVLASIAQDRIRIRGVSYPKAWFAAWAAWMRDDAAGARLALESARQEAEHTTQIEPVNGRALGLLAMIDAGLGRREEAVREALHAQELCTVETAADQAPIVACDLAAVYAWTGQPDLACSILEEWIARPAGFNLPGQPTYGDLMLNPLWDPVRRYPRFAALTARLAPVVTH